MIRPDLFLWLRPAIKIAKEGDDLLLSDAAGQVVHVHDPSNAAFRFVELLDGTQQDSSLQNEPLYQAIVPLLIERGWLVTLRNSSIAFFEKFPALTREISAFAHLYPAEADYHFELMTRKRVLIVGAGGIGTTVAFGLAAAGVGVLTVVDPDVVELTNLNRQFLYTLADIGAQKAHVLARELRRRFETTSVFPICENFDQFSLAEKLISSADLIFLCAESSLLLDEPNLVKGRTFIMSGYRGTVGMVGPLLDDRRGSTCWACLMDLHKRSSMRQIEELRDRRKDSWNPSGFSINALTGSISVRICVSVLSEQNDSENWLGRQFQVSVREPEIRSVAIEPTRCPHSSVPS
ncbi:HesA/MoeB/ThiF family protein [Bradyrhizobium japonicum]|uniref:HesA/MoeB/ThiF family protein n=1 Tax=Bradyrhizobium japonicum TaxID=375 RepID=UPI00200E715D|nr:ThiF family adenylyltransferase [Bradyrhizobium japonicum]